MLSVAARRIVGLTIPPLKHFGPLLVVWGAAMVMLVFIRDLGSSLMFFGAFLALLYVATGRFSYVLVGLLMFAVGRLRRSAPASPTSTTASTSGSTRSRSDAPEGAGQIQQSLFAQADGGLFGAGPRRVAAEAPGPVRPRLRAAVPRLRQHPARAAHRLHLRGDRRWSSACSAPAALILIYALIAARGFKTAVMAPDGFSKLLATGLTAVFALQAFVIIGGVTKVIPLTGVTLPFVSFGGSSVVANMILLALLLLISDRARRPPTDPVVADPIELAGLPA